MSNNHKTQKPKIVVIGGGFGGLYAVKDLKNAALQVKIC